MNLQTNSQLALTDYRQNKINLAFRTLLSIAKESEFYAKRLAGKDIRSTDELGLIEPLTFTDLSEHMYPASHAMCTGAYWGGFVLKSGGSTGVPKYSIYDKADVEHMITYALPALRAMGLSEGDRVANCLFVGDMYGGMISLEHENFRLGVTSFPLGPHIEPGTFLKVWRDFHVNAVEGQPATLVPLLRRVKALEPAFQIDKVIFGGSGMSDSDVQWLKEECGAKRVSSILAANDGGQFGYQCAHMTGRLHHAVDEYNFIEIVDEDGNRVRDGEVGKILITNLKKFAFPLIRYEIGDMGRMVPGTCSCGRADRRFEFLGRVKDSFIIGGAISRVADFKDALKELAISDIQLEASTRNHYDHLVLRVEASSNVSAEEVKAVIFLKMPILQRKVIERIHGFSVEVYSIGHFERNGRSGKIKEFHDTRETSISIEESSHAIQ